jgi:hypothetical protein
LANESGATNEPSESDRSIADALIGNAQAASGTNPNVPTSPKKFAMWFSRVACFVADAAIPLALTSPTAPKKLRTRKWRCSTKVSQIHLRASYLSVGKIGTIRRVRLLGPLRDVKDDATSRRLSAAATTRKGLPCLTTIQLQAIRLEYHLLAELLRQHRQHRRHRPQGDTARFPRQE